MDDARRAMLGRVAETLGRAGHNAASIHPAETGMTGTMFRIAVADGDVFCKIMKPYRVPIARDLNALLRREGIPVPPIIAAGADAETGEGYVILERAEGRDLAAAPQPARLWRQAGACLRAIHGIALPGFGQVIVGGAGTLKGRHASLAAAAAEFPDVEGLVAQLLDDATLTAAQGARILEISDALLRAGPARGRLLHNDFHGRHVFTDGGRITGVIDWDMAQVGVPEYDLAMSAYLAADGFAQVLEGYGTGYDAEIVARYKIIVALQKAGFARRRKAPHAPKNTAALLQVLAQLG